MFSCFWDLLQILIGRDWFEREKTHPSRKTNQNSISLATSDKYLFPRILRLRNPQAEVLNPNQHLKTGIMSFKENTVTEIMNVAPGLPPELAAKLLARAEDFIREQLPDGSARRKLSSLLLLKMKLPDINRNETIKEIVSLLVQIQDDGQLQQFLHEADESERRALLPELSEEMIASLCNAMQTSPTSFKVLIDQEYICRLATNLPDTERLKKMWDLLLANSMDEVGEWTRAAAVVLAAFIDRLEAPLKELDAELLTFARGYLEARQDATVFAEKFFKCDLGISTFPHWPPHGAGRILSHLAFQVSGEEQVQLLVEAQALDREETQSFKKRCEELERKNAEQQKGVEDLRKKLQKGIYDLTQTCKDLQKMSQALPSFSWDLSGFDFSSFSRDQRKESDKFQICSGITACMWLYPKGHSSSAPGKAGLFLHLDKVAKWSSDSEQVKSTGLWRRTLPRILAGSPGDGTTSSTVQRFKVLPSPSISWACSLRTHPWSSWLVALKFSCEVCHTSFCLGHPFLLQPVVKQSNLYNLEGATRSDGDFYSGCKIHVFFFSSRWGKSTEYRVWFCQTSILPANSLWPLLGWFSDPFKDQLSSNYGIESSRLFPFFVGVFKLSSSISKSKQ